MTATDDASSSRGRRVGQALLVVALALVLEVVLLLWLAAGARSSAAAIEVHAGQAQTALRGAQAALLAGDLPAARTSSDLARSELDEATSAAMTPQMRLLSLVPMPGNPVLDAQLLVRAASLVGDATGEVVDVYTRVAGSDPGAPRLFSGGQVDLAGLDSVRDSVRDVHDTLALAERQLQAVSATFPGTERLADARDAALAEVQPTLSTVDRLDDALLLLPGAVGAQGARTYLVTILNQAELRASGGTPLSVAVVSFDQGRFTVLRRAAVAQLPWPYGFLLSWRGAPGSPFNDSQGFRSGPFQNSNFHPDFRSAGNDLVNAWNVAGYGRVDGVIAIDVQAIAEVLRTTGPIPDSPYGELTADNLGQKLLIDGYRDFADDQAARQTANQKVVDTMLERITSGGSLLGVVRGLGTAAAGRHFQVWMADPALQSQVEQLGIDGAVRGPQGDQVGVFSQNANASKVDVFQRRKIAVTAKVRADGSARVTQRIRITNAVPADLPRTAERTGYTTTWSGSGYYVYRPPAATRVSVDLPRDWVPLSWRDYQQWTDDGHGHTMTRFKGELAPRRSAVVTVSYDLPPGTFGSDGSLAYSVHVDPQAIWQPAVVDVTAVGPSGARTTVTRTVVEPTTLTIPVT